MNKQPYTETFACTVCENRTFFDSFLQYFFAVTGISVFDVFAYSNTFQKKLPIIYANIRV